MNVDMRTFEDMMLGVIKESLIPSFLHFRGSLSLKKLQVKRGLND